MTSSQMNVTTCLGYSTESAEEGEETGQFLSIADTTGAIRYLYGAQENTVRVDTVVKSGAKRTTWAVRYLRSKEQI